MIEKNPPQAKIKFLDRPSRILKKARAAKTLWRRSSARSPNPLTGGTAFFWLPPLQAPHTMSRPFGLRALLSYTLFSPSLCTMSCPAILSVIVLSNIDLYCIFNATPLLGLLHCALVSGAMYCNRSCLCVCVWRAGGGWYHDNSKLHASIFTKLGL